MDAATMTEMNAFTPDWISAPGETIEDLLEERSWPQAELADRTGFTRKHVNDLVKGRAPITPDAAFRLEAVFGAPASFWLAREAQYRESLRRSRCRAEMRSEVVRLPQGGEQSRAKRGSRRRLARG